MFPFPKSEEVKELFVADNESAPCYVEVVTDIEEMCFGSFFKTFVDDVQICKFGKEIACLLTLMQCKVTLF
jgi:hypothetical protein